MSDWNLKFLEFDVASQCIRNNYLCGVINDGK